MEGADEAYAGNLSAIVSRISENRDSSAVRLSDVSRLILRLSAEKTPELYRARVEGLQAALAGGKPLGAKKASEAILMLLDLDGYLKFKEKNRT